MMDFVTLYQIQGAVRLRAWEITTSNSSWPCRKGCDECCRRLASVPQISLEEWRLIAAALDGLPHGVADQVRQRIRDSASASPPLLCPFLDTDSGACLVYDARPVACRAYGFYAEREFVLGCGRIESMGQQFPDIVWGNHPVLDQQLSALGPTRTFSEWLAWSR